MSGSLGSVRTGRTKNLPRFDIAPVFRPLTHPAELIIRGVNLFPSQVEAVLLDMSEIKPHYLLIVDRINNLDTLELKVEVDEAFFLDKVSQLETLRGKIQDNIENSIGLGIKVTLVEPRTIERSEGKSKRVVDNRKF